MQVKQTVRATQIVRTLPKPPKPAPNPALVAVAGFVRREIEHAVTPARTAESFTPAAAVAQSVTTQAVSPLGTQTQLDAEQTATRTANTLPVALTKLVLKTGWYVTALGEYSKVGGPDAANLAQLSRSVDEYAMGAAFQQQILNPMTSRAVMQVAPPHTWYGQMVPGSRILYDNPDTVYRFMAVNKTSTYVIRGKFENWDPAHPENVPADTTFSLLTGLSGNTAAVLNRDDLEINANGEFQILVSGDPKPADYNGNYLQLTSDSTLIAARDTLSDWNSQQPMSLSIERVSGPPNSFLAQMGIFTIPLIGPAVSDSPLLTQLVSIIPPLPELPIVRGAVTSVIMVIGLQMEREYIRVATVDAATGDKREPNVFTDPTSNAAFLNTQLQSAGYFQLKDDEALILTIDRKDAGYFNVPVTNDWTITDNYWDQQTSLNNVQAVPDGAGGTKYTIVISKTDPGVYNWVSTGGLNQGTASIRFQDLGVAVRQSARRSSRSASFTIRVCSRREPCGSRLRNAIRRSPRGRPASTTASHPSRRHRPRYAVTAPNAATSREKCSTASAGFGSGPVKRISVAPQATRSATGAMEASTSMPPSESRRNNAVPCTCRSVGSPPTSPMACFIAGIAPLRSVMAGPHGIHRQPNLDSLRATLLFTVPLIQIGIPPGCNGFGA